jgi:hypothetical protein
VATTVQPPLSLVVVNPIDSAANSWIKAQLSGVPTPGTIPPGGLKGFKRETGWDVKKGKGTQGATITLKDQSPVEGSVTLQLVTSQDFRDWDDFVENVLDLNPADQVANGLSWYYPGHTSIGLNAVVVKHYTGIEYQGRGMYHATFEVLEWFQPPPKSIVQTVASTEPDQDEDGQTTPEDPRITAMQAQIAAANQAGST